MKLFIYIKLLIYSMKNLFFNVIIIQNTKISKYIFLQNFIFFNFSLLLQYNRIYTINIVYINIKINFNIFFKLLLRSKSKLTPYKV